jgi:hypothetical protein
MLIAKFVSVRDEIHGDIIPLLLAHLGKAAWLACRSSRPLIRLEK